MKHIDIDSRVLEQKSETRHLLRNLFVNKIKYNLSQYVFSYLADKKHIPAAR